MEKIEGVIKQIVNDEFLEQWRDIEDKLSEKSLPNRCSDYLEYQRSLPSKLDSTKYFGITFKSVSPSNSDVIRLINQLNLYQIDLYGMNKCNLELPKTLIENKAFMVGAYHDQTLIGIGVIKLLDQNGYSKVDSFGTYRPNEVSVYFQKLLY